LVKSIKRVSAARVFSYWLKYEYEGRKSFRRHVRSLIPRKYIRIIREQNLESAYENEIRYAILLSYRKFAYDYRCAEWWEAELERKDLKKILVIHASHWHKLSGNSLRAYDIAKSVNNFESIDTELKRSKEVKKILDNSEKKVKDRSMLVVVRTRGDHELTVIDGVHRAIRWCLYYLVRNAEPWENRRMYLGIVPRHEFHNEGVRESIESSK
jgi:hypothetical protein